MKQSFLLIFALTILHISCGKQNKSYPKLAMTTDQLVNVIVQIYAANAANEINDPLIRDSMANIYMAQVSETTSIPLDVIRSDFEKLKQMPDSLFILQSAALDTLRSIYEKNYYKTKERK